MSFASLYSGIGGFDLALTRAGWKCKWANELDKYACQVYRKNFGAGELVEGNIRHVKAEDIPDVDLIAGGFPCQSFSLAGRREGFADIRGTLFFEIARIAKAKRPALLLLEKVKGLLSNDEGRTFGTILEELGNLGYWVEWQTLNSKYFGVPQNRERVFIVGHSRDRSTKQIFPIGEAGEILGAPRGEAQGGGERVRDDDPQCANTLSARYHKDGSENLIFQQHHQEGGIGGGAFRVFEGDSPTLSGMMGSGGNNVPMVLAPNNFAHEGGDPDTRKRLLTDTVPSLQAEPGQTQGSFVIEPAPAESALIQEGKFLETRKDGVSHCLKGAGGGSSKNMVVQPCLTPDRQRKMQNGRRFKENEEPSFALTGQDIPGIMITDFNQDGNVYPKEDASALRVKQAHANLLIASALDTDGYLRSSRRPRDENGETLLLPIGYRRIRRFTPRECERLQGFPDDWTRYGLTIDGKIMEISDTQRYKMCGNAVTVNVVEVLAYLLMQSLG